MCLYKQINSISHPKKMNKHILISIILITISVSTFACRFTIREIGYTRLNIETYLIRLEADTVQNRALVRDFKNLAYAYSINANINYQISHTTGKVPEIKCTNSRGDVIIQKQAVTLDGVHTVFKELLYSPLQKMMYSQIGNTFAFVVVFSDDKGKLNDIVDSALEQFKKIAPNLDKKVDEHILKVVIPANRRDEEEIVLRSMGVDAKSGKPAVVVIYGRGRLTDVPLIGDRITTHNILNQLVTLGTDCECGIDLSPLLQRAIPFNWDDRMGQDVTDMLDIDVENPMILTEMGRILSKESLETGKSEFSFVPQTIDLDSELGKNKTYQDEVVVPKEKSSALHITATVLSVFILIVVAIGLLMFLKKRRF